MMKRALRLLVLLSMAGLPATVLQAQDGRQEILWSFGWRFHAGDVDGAASTGLDDSQWCMVDLPHDFQIGQPWVEPDASERPDNTDVAANIKSRLSSRGFKEMGRAWYRKSFVPDTAWRGRRVLLDFEGIMMAGDVYLNGQRVGGTDYGYVGFETDVTKQLQWGRENVVAVMADTREPQNSRWYTGGGLFRDVHLRITAPDLYFERHPLYIRTRQNRYVSLSAELTNNQRSRTALLHVQITDADGKQVYETQVEAQHNTPARTTEVHVPEFEIPAPRLWDTDHPHLYTARVQLLRKDGSVADQVEEQFGVRTVEIGPDFGLKLNGRKVLLKGFANHHSLGALGAAAYPRAMEKRIRLMKQFGVNHIRTSHNPYSRSFIRLCDQLGILVVDELYDKWTRQHTGGRVPFQQLWQYDVPEWVKRDRNSPSVVLWSLGNELQQDANQPYNDWGVTMYQLQRTLLQRYDSTRLVTVAMHPRYRNWQTDSLPCDLALHTDVQAYNYRYMYFPGDGRRFPWMTFYQSEASVAAMGENYFAMDLSRVIGLAYWGAIDYLGESQGWPQKGWTQGVFDISLQPKPKAYLMKSIFLPDEPVVHIAIVDKKGDQMWNGVQTGNDGLSDHWNRLPGQHLSLITYTNAEEVELLLNGRSLGTKKNPTAPKQRNQVRWDDITFEAGVLEAVARTGGKVVARHRIETTGEAVRLVMKGDNTAWKCDGLDLQHVTVQAVDKRGRVVPMAGQTLRFSVEGDASIVGVINGDLASDELTVGNTRSLFRGSCEVILRAGRSAGKVTLKAAAVDGSLRPAALTVATKCY